MRACLNSLAYSEGLSVQPGRIDALAAGQIRCEFVEPFLKLTGCAHGIVALAMMETDGHVDEGLQKQPARPRLRRPGRLQHFVALEELAIVEEPDSLP